MKRSALVAIILSILFAHSARPAEPKASLDDLKKLEIICFVPSYLPKDFKLKNAKINYEDDPNEGHQGQKVVTYAIEWSNSRNASFSIDSAWEGIGDRNIMETEDSEEAEFQSPLFGRVYLIYTPKGKGDAGVKKEILSNWVEDVNMHAEGGRDAKAHPVLGRFHGFTGTNMTVVEFEKIVNSLHPIKGDTKT